MPAAGTTQLGKRKSRSNSNNNNHDETIAKSAKDDSTMTKGKMNHSRGSGNDSLAVANPAQLLLSSSSSSSTQAVVVSVSEKHATIVLRSKNHANSGVKEDEYTTSILKLSTVPSHLEKLPVTVVANLGDLQDGTAMVDPNDDTDSSKRILAFLQTLEFTLSSESGAEYSYYTTTAAKQHSAPAPRSWWPSLNPFQKIFGGAPPTVAAADSSSSCCFTVELVSPASTRQLERSLPMPGMSLIEETPHLYETIVQPYVQALVTDGKSLAWLQNVVSGTKEQERLLLNTDGYILNIDTKWRSHPDALTTPRAEWYNHSSIKDLYCLGIVKDSALTSLRDLRGDAHLVMLKDMLRQGRETIATVYNVPMDQIRVFVHYPPQFYQFHVHFCHLSNDFGCQVERAHLLTDIIQNLELDSKFYTKRIISYKVNASKNLFTEAQQKQQQNSAAVSHASSL